MKKTALLIVDIQNDYFPGGNFEQEGAETAADKAALVLDHFRKNDMPVIHIRHESLGEDAGFFIPGTQGAEIHQSVLPHESETVILKHFPNSFRETGLETTLRNLGTERVVIVGMMTLMCIDATARASKDLGFEVVVISDGCAARSLQFGTTDIPANQVHGAFLAALQMFYADVVTTETFIQS